MTTSAAVSLAPPASSGTTADRPAAVSRNRARRTAAAGRDVSAMASATSARARPVTPPPHGFSRGCDGSKMVTRAPRRAGEYAAHAPAGPAPTVATSMGGITVYRLMAYGSWLMAYGGLSLEP